MYSNVALKEKCFCGSVIGNDGDYSKGSYHSYLSIWGRKEEEKQIIPFFQVKKKVQMNLLLLCLPFKIYPFST